eukprot:2805385-Rhodomonas_salina.4
MQRTSMLSRDRASGGEEGSWNAVCSAIVARYGPDSGLDHARTSQDSVVTSQDRLQDSMGTSQDSAVTSQDKKRSEDSKVTSQDSAARHRVALSRHTGQRGHLRTKDVLNLVCGRAT